MYFLAVFLLIKSVMNLIVPYFLDIMNTGVPYLDCCIGVSTPIYTKQISSFQNVLLFILCIGY